jgi:hypothetical protein
MTKPNPFDLAIFALKRERAKAVIVDPCPICSYEAAIRLLEAAGKVDKLLALASIDAVRRVLVNDGMPGMEREMRDIRAILAALADEEKP